MTEAGQISLLGILSSDKIAELSVEKIKRMAQRAKGVARVVLSQKLAHRKDCLDIVLSLCETEQAKLQLLWSYESPDLSSIKD